jgi:hypothetical protein
MNSYSQLKKLSGIGTILQEDYISIPTEDPGSTIDLYYCVTCKKKIMSSNCLCLLFCIIKDNNNNEI